MIDKVNKYRSELEKSWANVPKNEPDLMGISLENYLVIKSFERGWKSRDKEENFHHKIPFKIEWMEEEIS